MSQRKIIVAGAGAKKNAPRNRGHLAQHHKNEAEENMRKQHEETGRIWRPRLHQLEEREIDVSRREDRVLLRERAVTRKENEWKRRQAAVVKQEREVERLRRELMDEMKKRAEKWERKEEKHERDFEVMVARQLKLKTWGAELSSLNYRLTEMKADVRRREALLNES